MTIKRTFFVFSIIFHIVFAGIVYAQTEEDAGNMRSNGTVKFDEDWAINPFVNYSMGVFNGLKHTQYETDRPWNIGIGLRYRNYSAQITIPMSIEALKDLWSFSFEADFFLDNIYFEAYLKSYPHLVVSDPEIKEPRELDTHSSGIMATFVHNKENHNLRSVNKLDRMQNKSSGSLLYGAGVFHSSLYSSTGTIDRYTERQHLLYFGPGIGYSYTWIFPRGYFLNVLLIHYLTPAINLNKANWVFVPQLQPRIVVGHHEKTWSLNIRMADDASFIIWNKDDIDALTLISITVMFSKRF